MTSIADIDLELNQAKLELNILQITLSEFNAGYKDLLKIRDWIKNNNAPKTLNEVRDEENNILNTNQEDFDLYKEKEILLQYFMDLLEITVFNVIGVLIKDGSSGLEAIVSKYRRTLQVDIAEYTNTINTLTTNLVLEMYTYHNIKQ